MSSLAKFRKKNIAGPLLRHGVPPVRLTTFVLVAVVLPAVGVLAELPGKSVFSLQGEDRKQVEALRNTIAQLKVAGKFSEADGPAKEVLAICEKALRPGHWQTGDARREVEDLKSIARLPEEGRTAMASMGALEKEHEALTRRARYADAERMCRDVFEICHRWMGADHPWTAYSDSYLCLDLLFQGKYDEAESRIREASAIWLKALGPDHPAMAIGYANLAIIFDARGKYAEGERLHRQALDLHSQAFGPGRHPGWRNQQQPRWLPRRSRKILRGRAAQAARPWLLHSGCWARTIPAPQPATTTSR